MNENENLPASPANTATAIATYLNEVEPQTTIGKLLKFTKGEFLLGFDGEIVPEGAIYTAACDLALAGFIRWQDGRPAESRLVRIASGDPPVRRENLGHHDRTKWDADARGEVRDPWQPCMYVPMQSADTGEVVTFTTGSASGIKSVHRLLRTYAAHAASHPNEYPSVKLRKSFWLHPEKSIGRVYFPDFEPAGYVDRSDFCTALAALGVSVDTQPAALPAPKVNDAVPY
jgi:hypothetical protein